MALVAVVGVVYIILESIGLALVSEKHRLYFLRPLLSPIQSRIINRFPPSMPANLIVQIVTSGTNPQDLSSIHHSGTVTTCAGTTRVLLDQDRDRDFEERVRKIPAKSKHRGSILTMRSNAHGGLSVCIRRAASNKTQSGSRTVSGQIIVSNWSSYIDILYLAFRYDACLPELKNQRVPSTPWTDYKHISYYYGSFIDTTQYSHRFTPRP